MSARNPLRQDLRVTTGLESQPWTDSFIQQMFLEGFLCASPHRRVKGAVLLLAPYKAWLVAEEMTFLHKKSNKDLTMCPQAPVLKPQAGGRRQRGLWSQLPKAPSV